MTEYDEVLRLVNQARVSLGWDPIVKLPKGRREDPYTCSLAMALPCGVWVYPTHILFDREECAERVADAWDKEVVYLDNPEEPEAIYDPDYDWLRPAVELPYPLYKFVQQFDEGEYLELVK